MGRNAVSRSLLGCTPNDGCHPRKSLYGTTSPERQRLNQEMINLWCDRGLLGRGGTVARPKWRSEEAGGREGERGER